MPAFRLATIGRVELSGPLGPVALADPRHLAMLVRLAVAPGRSLDTNELLLTIWPHLTPQRGAVEVSGAAAAIAAAAGAELVARAGGRWSLDAAVECDVDRASASSAPSFAAGLALAETPEWDEWVATVQRDLALRPARTWISPLLRRVIAGAGLALLALVAYRLARPGTIDGFAPGDRAILADIDNATADSTLGRAVLVAAAVGFQQSSRIELLPRDQVLRSLQVGRSSGGDTLITTDLALEVAAQEAVPWVVAIRIETDRARNRVTTRLLRTGTGEVVHTSGRWADGGLALVEAVGETIRRLLERLGEPARALRGQPALEFATTSSLDALRAYAEGSAAWSLGSYQLAGDYWRRAIALDTGFAMAMGSLGGYYYYHHDRAQGERYYGEALARRGRLTEWERLQIEERYAGWRGDRDSALALGRLIVARFPRAQTYYSLGTQLLQMDRCPEALESLERARQLDPRSVPAHINVATCRKRLGQSEEARQAYLAAGRLDSTALYRGNINLEYAGAAMLAGHPLEAESALIRMTRRSGMTDQALGYRGLGFLAFWRGEAVRAREHFLRAAGYSREQRAANSLLRNLLLVAAMARAGGDEAAVPPILRQVDSLAALPSMAPGFLGLAAEAYLEDQDAASLRRLLEMTRARADPRTRDDSLLVHYLGGTVALAAGDPRTALAAFDRAAGTRYPAALGLRRAQAWEQLGELDSTRAELARIVAGVKFGSEDQIAWTQALIAIGRVEERAGRFDDAIASYRRFLAHWKDGDPSLPDVGLVRGRLDALLGRRDRRSGVP